MRYSVLAAAVAVFAGPALAGGPVVVVEEAPVVVAESAPSFDWTGFYAGLHFGQGTLSSDVAEVDHDFYGLQIGYLRDFGTLVAGGELSYSTGDLDDGTADFDATRIKLIGGYDAGRFLPYAFIGITDAELSNELVSLSDTMTAYGLGGKFAFGANGQHVLGLEYLREEASNFASTGQDLDNSQVSISYNFRF